LIRVCDKAEDKLCDKSTRNRSKWRLGYKRQQQLPMASCLLKPRQDDDVSMLLRTRIIR